MGVYIKGMNVPKSCRSCDIPLRALKCPVQTEEEAMRYYSCRHKDCPIIPVQPHGRLIDADALYEDCALDNNYEVAATTTRINEYMQLKIDAAPTVIEAEESEG